MTHPPAPPNDPPSGRPARGGALINRLIEPPAATPARWHGQLRLLSGLLLPLMGLALIAALSLMGLAAAGTSVNPASTLSALAALVILALAYGVTRTGRYLAAALLTVGVTLVGILWPLLAEAHPQGTDPFGVAFLIIPVVLGGLLLPLRYAGGLAAGVLALAWGLLTRLGYTSPLTPLTLLVLLGAVSVLVVVGAAIRDRDAARIAAQAAVLHATNSRLTAGLAEVEQRTSEMVVLNELGEMLQACATPDEAFQIVTASAQQLFPGQPGAMCVQSASRTSVVTMTEWGQDNLGARVFAPDDCWALRLGRAHLSPLNDPGRRCRHLAGTGAAHLCLPLLAQGESLGLLHLVLADAGDGADKRRRLAQTMADNLALALANLKLRESLRSQSIRDALTGLYNRRFLEETLDRELHRAKRANRPLGVVMLDIDHFKQFNDTFGHGAGDATLREVGDYLQRQVRGSDIACRLGGEEFVILMPEAPVDVVLERATAIQVGLRQLNVAYEGQLLGSVSISSGIAMFPEHGATWAVLLKAADSALYEAKRAGRDRVVMHA